MEVSVSHEAFVFIASCLCGGLIVLLYDLFRMIRRTAGSSFLMVHVQDGLFWGLTFLILFFSILYINNGILRMYELVGVILGGLLYELALSKWVLRILDRIFTFFSIFFKIFFKILLTPLLFAYNILYRCFCLVLLPLKKLGKRAVKRMQESMKRTARFIKKK